MFNQIGAGALEIGLLLANAFVCILIVGYCYSRRDQREFWSPPLYVAAVYIYYVILGPGIAVAFEGTTDRGMDMRSYYVNAWTGALVALISWLMGYWAKGLKPAGRPPVAPPVDPSKLLRVGFWLNIGGLAAFALTVGIGVISLINPFVGADEPTSIAYTGAFANYFALAVNFLIPGIALLFLLRLRGNGRWVMVVAWLIVAVGIYTSLGFRYRLVLLAGALVFVYFIHSRRRPNLLLFGLVATIFVAAMGFIGENRMYGRGLQLKDSNKGFMESLVGGFGEAGIFGTSGAVLAHVPDDRPYVGFEPILQTLLMPVPSKLYPEKNTSGYLVETLMSIYGHTHYEGAAYMLFADWYAAFGWFGLVGVHIGLGALCRWLWQWYQVRRDDPLALLVYAAAVPYLYVVFSRGYLPQVVMLFVYSVLPAVVVYRVVRPRLLARRPLPPLRSLPRTRAVRGGMR